MFGVPPPNTDFSNFFSKDSKYRKNVYDEFFKLCQKMNSLIDSDLYKTNKNSFKLLMASFNTILAYMKILKKLEGKKNEYELQLLKGFLIKKIIIMIKTVDEIPSTTGVFIENFINKKLNYIFCDFRNIDEQIDILLTKKTIVGQSFESARNNIRRIGSMFSKKESPRVFPEKGGRKTRIRKQKQNNHSKRKTRRRRHNKK